MSKKKSKIQPPINIDPDKIGDHTLLELYKNIQLVWERAYKNQKTGFNIRRKLFTTFRKRTGLKIIIQTQNAIETCAQNEGFFDHSRKQNIFIFNSTNSQAYDLFRHLRNSVAHGNFEKKNIAEKTYLTFSDFHRKRRTMIGKIELSELKTFIEALHATKKPKNTNKKKRSK